MSGRNSLAISWWVAGFKSSVRWTTCEEKMYDCLRLVGSGEGFRVQVGTLSLKNGFQCRDYKSMERYCPPARSWNTWKNIKQPAERRESREGWPMPAEERTKPLRGCVSAFAFFAYFSSNFIFSTKNYNIYKGIQEKDILKGRHVFNVWPVAVSNQSTLYCVS